LHHTLPHRALPHVGPYTFVGWKFPLINVYDNQIGSLYTTSTYQKVSS
jgi:hypothetical protein